MILEAFNRYENRIGELIVLGGGARNPAWLQVLSDIFGLPLNVPNYLEEAASMGAAITAGVGVGAFRNFDIIDKFLTTVHRYEPQADENDCAVYREMQARFDECYHALEPIFNKM
jgi:xylulokinase